MPSIIPVTAHARQTLAVTVGGQTLDLSLWWQPLSLAWYIAVSYRDTVLAQGFQLAPWQLLLGPRDDIMGDLMVVATPGHEFADLGRDAWTTSHQLLYFTPLELAALSNS